MGAEDLGVVFQCEKRLLGPAAPFMKACPSPLDAVACDDRGSELQADDSAFISAERQFACVASLQFRRG